jgi:hypothetical protein
MNIPIQSFEQYIDETILKRGFQYFKKGLVNEPEEIGHGEYEAIVEGTDLYTVQITMKNDVITEYDCTCPYDMGSVCKHVVAVIFYLQQNELNLKVKVKKNPAEAKKTPKKKTVAEQVDDILEKIPPESVKEYLKEQCIKDSSFRHLFLARFAYLVIPESKALYVKQVRAILKSETNRSGYIEYSNARYVGKSVYELVQTAVSQVEMSNYRTAMYIACAVLEEMTEALQYVDDSNGDIGGCIDPALEVLYDIERKPIQEELRKELFDYCLKAFTMRIFKGWDWHFGMLDLATLLAKDSTEARQIHLHLDEIKPSGQSWDWDFKNAQLIRVKLIKKIEGDEKATVFLEQNISNPDFRKKVIETAIAKKDFSKAIALAEEGIKLNQKESPGFADDWRDYLLEVSIIRNDTEQILKYARHLFVHGNRVKKPYFDLLKKHVIPENQEIAIAGIIKDISADNRWGGNPLIADIYIWEEQWEKLFSFVKSNISLHLLETYEKYLVNDFAGEISELYQMAILKYMENNISRDHYRNACRYLRRMMKMGARMKANEVIQELRKLYPKRKALMEELLKV